MTPDPDECGESAYTEDHCYVHDSPWPVGHQVCFEMQERIMRREDEMKLANARVIAASYRQLLKAMMGGGNV